MNFVCPIPGCGLPFLEFHHFDPPYRERPHHDPSGMIALCPTHHAQADGNTSWSKEELRVLKAAPPTLDGTLAKLPWLTGSCQIRMGDNYVFRACEIVQDGVLLFRFGPDSFGVNAVTLLLKNADDELLLQMQDSAIVGIGPGVKDVDVSANAARIRVWGNKSGCGIDASFKYIGITELEAELAHRMPPIFILDPMMWTADDYLNLSQIPTLDAAIRHYATVDRETMARVAIRYLWACRMTSDGELPVLEIERCDLWHNRKVTRIRTNTNEPMSNIISHAFGGPSVAQGNLII